MTLVSFPIAYPDHPVNLLSYVFPITLLLPQDDTSDVIPRHTMLRHAYHLSAARNFRLNPKEVSGPSSLDPNQPICIPASMCSASRAGETRARATQEHASKAAKRMSTSSPRPSSQERERSRHAPGLARCARLRPRCARPAPPALMGLSTPRVSGLKPRVCSSNQNVPYLTLI